MSANNLMALIFANTNDDMLPSLTMERSMASLPFGSRYRIIDFHLSNLVNAGVSTVQIVPKSNYRSLMEHIGSGKAWDLDRKNGGLMFLPPFISGQDTATYHGHIDAISKIEKFKAAAKEEYIILCDCDTVLNIDIDEMLQNHIKSGADVSVAYSHGPLPKNTKGRSVLEIEEDGILREILLSKETGRVCNFGLGISIFNRQKLLELNIAASERGYETISRGIVSKNMDNLKVYCYKVDGFVAVIDSVSSYVKANLDVLKCDVRKSLFNPKRPIYTKTRDDMPTKYGLQSEVKNTICGEGCVIEGKVENCVLSRGVKIGKGSVVKNSILMQETVIGENCNIEYLTTDKNVEIADNTDLRGAENNYFVISKNENI